ncbi:MAG: metalloregulator ArsR/SmtB family transcription factor [Pseudomonadota bacterium]
MANELYTSFHALGDPTRLAVVEMLLDGPATVSDLAKPHSMALPSFTKHLGILERAGLITSSKSGRVRTCFIHADSMSEIDDWFTDRRKLWSGRLDRLAAHLEATPKDT